MEHIFSISKCLHCVIWYLHKANWNLNKRYCITKLHGTNPLSFLFIAVSQLLTTNCLPMKTQQHSTKTSWCYNKTFTAWRGQDHLLELSKVANQTHLILLNCVFFFLFKNIWIQKLLYYNDVQYAYKILLKSVKI